IAGLLSAGAGRAEGLHTTVSAGAQVTYTSNVDYASSTSSRHSDFVGAVSGTIGIGGRVEGLNVNGSVAVTFQGDSHGNYTGNVSVAPVGSITGTYKAID